MNQNYPSKLLLFGEYTVLTGSQALAVPMTTWNGIWTQTNNRSDEARCMPSPYAEWLYEQGLISSEVVDQIHQDAKAGWRYKADIPEGYGVGSSGAFVAAVFDRYVRSDRTWSFDDVRNILAHMECFFHGTSSGMDPLVSYSRCAVYRDENGVFHHMDDPGWPDGWKVKLIDSGAARSTGPLVNHYRDEMKSADFAQQVARDLIPFVNHAIHFYLAGESILLENCISTISQFQRTYFKDLIPAIMLETWDMLLQQRTWMKFCGAGGGGFFLVIQPNDAPLPEGLKVHKIV